MALAAGEPDPKKKREAHKKAMRDVVEKKWETDRNAKIKKLLEDGPEKKEKN